MTDSTGKRSGDDGRPEIPNLLDMEAYRKDRNRRGNAMGSFRQQYYVKADKSSPKGHKAGTVGPWRGRLIVVFQVLVVLFGLFLMIRGCSSI
jgi:hypothetical protein